ncbi:MAG: hypothetical protein ACI308_02395, partial [Muribaculaceae bacterium]
LSSEPPTNKEVIKIFQNYIISFFEARLKMFLFQKTFLVATFPHCNQAHGAHSAHGKSRLSQTCITGSGKCETLVSHNYIVDMFASANAGNNFVSNKVVTNFQQGMWWGS